MHIPFAQFGLFGSADTARVRLENDTDDSSFYFTFCLEYGSRLGACYLHTAVSIDFAQAAVAPSPVGIEVVADFKFVSCETLLYLFGGDVLLATCNPRATGHRLHVYSACFHGDGVGIPLATEKPKFAGSFCFGSVGKVIAAYADSDERLARHILRRH